MLVIIAVIVVIIAVVALFIGAWWGAPIALVLGVVAALYMARARKEDASVGTIESGRRNEPTGVPRKCSGGAETANERVGQT